MNAIPKEIQAEPVVGVTDVVNRWDEKASLRRYAIRSQVIDALEAQEIKETASDTECRFMLILAF